MSPSSWAGAAPGALQAIMDMLARSDPFGFAAIRAEQAAGGRLRVVIDQPEGARMVRLRVRLLSETGPNRWVYARWFEAEPPRPKIVGG